MGGMAATVALGWRGTFAAPMRRQRNYLDMTWWDPYVEDITDVDTYLRRKFRQDVTDKSTGVGVEALKKILAEIVAAGKASGETPRRLSARHDAPSVCHGEKGLKAMRSLVEIFHRNSGSVIQFTVFSAQELKDAQLHPEKYENLQVRVCGWNVRWNDLCKSEQDAYIRRAENVMKGW